MAADGVRLRGRQAQAARNDEVILQAAREVFLADPDAPISAVAARAGVGIGALYHRYASKQDLLRTLCRSGQETYLRELRRALAQQGDPWESFTAFLRSIVAAGTHGLVSRLAGMFVPDEEQLAIAEQMRAGSMELFEKARTSGELRDDVSYLDVEFLLEFLAQVQLGDAERTAGLRQRYLAVIIDGLRGGSGRTPLPGQAPTWQEQTARWVPRSAGLPG